jgi:hypothetical protein
MMLPTAPLLFIFELKLAMLLGAEQFALYALAMAALFLATHGFVKVFALYHAAILPTKGFISLSFVSALMLSMLLAGGLIAFAKPIATMMHAPELSVLLLMVAIIIPFRVAGLLAYPILKTQHYFTALFLSKGMIFEAMFFLLLPFFIMGHEQNISFLLMVYLFIALTVYLYLIMRLYRQGFLVSLTAQDWAKFRAVFMPVPKTIQNLPNCAPVFLLISAFFVPPQTVGLLALSFLLLRLFDFIKYIRPEDALLWGLGALIALVIAPYILLSFFGLGASQDILIYLAIILLFASKAFYPLLKNLTLADGQKLVAALAGILAGVMVQFLDVGAGLKGYLLILAPALLVYFLLALNQLWRRHFRHFG